MPTCAAMFQSLRKSDPDAYKLKTQQELVSLVHADEEFDRAAFCFKSWQSFVQAASAGAFVTISCDNGCSQTDVPGFVLDHRNSDGNVFRRETSKVIFVKVVQDSNNEFETPRVVIDENSFRSSCCSRIKLQVSETVEFRMLGADISQHLRYHTRKEIKAWRQALDRAEHDHVPCATCRQLLDKASNPGAIAGGIIGSGLATFEMVGLYAYAISLWDEHDLVQLNAQHSFWAKLKWIFGHGVFSWKGFVTLLAIGPGKYELCIPLGVCLGNAAYKKFNCEERSSRRRARAWDEVSVESFIRQRRS
eukprot:TRINITY_DN66047_c0_g1_i1.p1 TRINITY_DN66047_c0_g1~~TRINITY_DN66047_c0_g1_i1.p1  ORF type:complete len:313 (+),score=43.45 TRINITY_DN66047_c0_g1_i1:25-939(+)